MKRYITPDKSVGLPHMCTYVKCLLCLVTLKKSRRDFFCHLLAYLCIVSLETPPDLDVQPLDRLQSVGDLFQKGGWAGGERRRKHEC